VAFGIGGCDAWVVLLRNGMIGRMGWDEMIGK
jgi:hypothetical protein